MYFKNSAFTFASKLVVDNETGILIPVEQQTEAPFEPVNPDKFARDLADGVNTVINNKELRKKMELNGRKRVEEHFDWVAIAKQTKDLYQSLI